MKLPQIPPNYRNLLEKADYFQHILLSINKIQVIQRDDRYLHWNDLRRRPAPEGFTHEEWWVALKLGRMAKFQRIPLLDRAGNSFGFGLPDQLMELLHGIDRGLGASFAVPEAVREPASRNQYIISTLAQEAISSSQLEGAATTREVAREMLRSGRPPRDNSERMILNNYRTMSHIRELAHQPDLLLTPELVFELHRLVTDGTLEKPNASGRLRLEAENVRVEDMEGTVYHQPPPAAQLPDRIRIMCDFANGRTPATFIHPVIRAILLHFWLAYDHPFVDGNGRTARALFYWAMLRANYQLFEFISISEILLRAPARYAMAFLHTETDGNDLTYFLLHQAGVIEEAVKNLHGYIARKKDRLVEAARSLRGAENLNHRQQALLAHALREPHTRYKIIAHQNSHQVSHQTARDDLFDLVRRGLLAVEKNGRSYTFRTPPDLEGRLEAGARASLHGVSADVLPEASPATPITIPVRSVSSSRQ